MAALDARVGRRATAAAIAAALQVVFYCLIVHEAVEPIAIPRSTSLETTLIEVPRRSRPATLQRKRPRMPSRHTLLKSQRPALPPVAQPITLPQATGRSPHPAIDWQQSIQGEVREQELRSHAGKLQFGFPHVPEPVRPLPPFGWDYAHTHRLEPLPGGGMLINLTDRCALVMYVIFIPVCKIGHIPINGHLFDDMRERRREREGGLP